MYQLADIPGAIDAFERSLNLEPSADAHTNVASAYILSTPPNAAKAIEHLQVCHSDDLVCNRVMSSSGCMVLQKALALAPEDGEINFNMGVIFEASECITCRLVV